MAITHIDIIRHGEPEGGRRYRGHGVNDPLSPKGWQQMWNAVPDQPVWNQVISSPLKRCLGFAEAIASHLGASLSVEEDLKEIGFGTWEGRTPDDISANEGDSLEKFILDPVHNRPEGAEPLDAFTDRVWKVYERVANDHKGKHVLIVAHAGVIRAITSKILRMHLDDVYSKLKIDYAAIASTVIVDGKPPTLILRA